MNTSLDRFLTPACNMLTTDDDAITAVHLVLGQRPSYAELIQARELADESGLSFRFRYPAELVVWRPCPSPRRDAEGERLPILDRPRPRGMTLGLPNLNEGTR